MFVLPKLNRQIWGWAFYDWANSAYAVSILAVVFQRYFVDRLATSGTDAQGNLIREVTILGAQIPAGSLWSWALSLSMILVVLLCPLIGAIADAHGRKKRILLLFCSAGSGATMLMVFLNTGMWQLGVVLFVISNISFVGGNVVYNALLIDVAPSESEMGAVSGFGWGLGYGASFLMLLLNMVLITFDFPSPRWAVPLCFLIVGLWWAVFAVPTFLWVPERTPSPALPKGRGMVTAGFSSLSQTARHLPRYPMLLLFMAAFFLYNDGIQTIIAQAATFAGYALGASLSAILPAFLMLQFVAFFGALLFIQVEKRLGTHKTLLCSLLIWLGILAWAFVLGSLAEFYGMAFVAGLVLGVSQSASRTLYARMVPPTESAAFFSLYAVVGKMSSIMGPALFSIGVFYAPDLKGVPILNPMAGSVLPLFLMVLTGTLLLRKVRVSEGRDQAAHTKTRLE